MLKGIKRTVISTPHLPNNWEGSMVDFIQNNDIPFRMRTRIVIENNLISDRLLMMLAVWCARSTLNYFNSNLFTNLLDHVESFIKGEISYQTLIELRDEIKKLLPNNDTLAFKETLECVQATIGTDAKDTAIKTLTLAGSILSHYSPPSDIQKKIAWKLRDMVLENLTSGEVSFIIKNVIKD